MTKETAIKIFEQKRVRSVWNDEDGKWYFSIVDVVDVLTESPNARKYWSVLKTRLKKENAELTTICSQLKMQSPDGKFYKSTVPTHREFCVLSNPFPLPKRNHSRDGWQKSAMNGLKRSKIRN